MQDSILYIILLLLCVVVYLLLKINNNKNESKKNEEIDKLKDSLTSSINTMSTSFNALSKDVTRDMTQALTKVDEKVNVFNQQVESINKSQDSFSRILAGVKQYGGLAEFSLASLLKDLLPATQYIANVKMKPDETRDVVEFAVKLQNDILCPIDSHWPIEKYKAIDDAYQAKNKDLLTEISQKRFREDLYYRLNVVPIHVPPLKERREDIPELAIHFMQSASKIAGLYPRKIADDALAVLQACDWPGNIRQLKNVIEWLLIMSPGKQTDDVTAAMLPPELGSSVTKNSSNQWTGEIMSLSLRGAREIFEREYLSTQLGRFGGNISRTAQFIGMERSALHRKLKNLNVSDTGRSNLTDHEGNSIE